MPFLAFALLVAVAIAGTYILALFSLGEHIFGFWPELWILMLVAPWWALQERDRRRAKRRDATVALRYRTY